MIFFQDDDRKLLTRMRQRDRAAFDALYDRYAARLLTFACKITGNRADAEDLVQETFLALFSATSEFQGGSRFLTYLTAIIVRRHRDFQRRPRLPLVTLLEETDEGRNVPNSHSPVESAVVAAVAFQQALATLDEPLQTAFLLVASQGLTHKEAAEILGSPIGTIKWRVAEATRRMRTILSGEKEQRKGKHTQNGSQHSDDSTEREKEKGERDEPRDLLEVFH